MRRLLLAGSAALAVAGVALLAPGGADAGSRAYPTTTCALFPADNIWHARVDRLPRNVRSAQWMSHMQASTRLLHPDFGPMPYGIPVTVTDGSHPKVSVRFTYASESDRLLYPLGSDTRIEGGAASTGDRHAIELDRSTCRIYETWNTRLTSTGWTAGSGASWYLKSNTLRPAGWTSADAAGLPILPGLLRYDEVLAGSVDHAIRFTTNTTNRAYIWPARHQAGSVTDATYPPMGARFRLKATYPISSFRPDTQVVLRGMKAYGMILADNGSPWFFQGTSDWRWPAALIADLKRVPASAFEAVDESSLMISSGSAAARPQP